MPAKLVTKLSPPKFKTWTSLLESRIATKTQSFLSDPHEWIKCIKPSGIKECAFIWASESNNYTCSYVYLKYKNVNLGGKYFEGAIPIVETQVAKGKHSNVLADD